MYFIMLSFTLIFFILSIFFLISKKSDMDILATSVFECGFSSYYFSRFSFSMHYFIIGLIFLFLDLELCYLMPFFSGGFSEFKFTSFLWIFVSILILGLAEEWRYGALEWKF